MTTQQKERLNMMIKTIQHSLISGERVIISRTGIDIDLEEEDEPADTLLTTEEFITWLEAIEMEAVLSCASKE